MNRRMGRTLVLLLALTLVQGVGASGGMSPHANYLLHCSGCHGQSGTGNPAGGIPPFPNQVGVFSHLPDGRRYVSNVPGVMGSSLSAAEIAEVLNYVMETWAGPSLTKDFVPFGADEIATYLSDPVADPVVLRRKVAKKLAVQGFTVPEYPWP